MNKPMRHLPNVIDEMLTHVPSGHSLVHVFESLRSSASFSAPECMRDWWVRVAESIEEHFPRNPLDFNDWQMGVVRVWLDNPTITREQLKVLDTL